MYQFSGSGLNRSAVNDIVKLRALADDLERLANGHSPNSEQLENAPLLTDYHVDSRPLPCLVGWIQGHPRITGPTARTSDLWVHAQALGWARTYSRWYRLGQSKEVIASHFIVGHSQ